MKRIYAFLTALMMLFCLISSASGQTTSQSSKKSGYVAIPFLEKYKEYTYKGDINVLYLVCTTAAEYFPNSFAIWKPMAEKINIHMDLMGPPEYSDASLISTLESSLASGKYDIVVLYPITPAAITPLLDSIWKTYHVPILSYAFSPDTKCGHYYLGTSYYTAGTVLGKSIVDYVNANSAYFGTLKMIPVAVYMNPQGSEQYKRIQGALDVLKKDGRFTLIKEYAANGEAACLTQTETLLTEHPEVEVILTQIDNDVTGAYQAIVSGTYKHSSHISLWGFDATGAVLNLMAKGGKGGSVQGSSFIDHYQSGEALCELIPILVGAAKQRKLIQFDKPDYNWLGTALSNYYLTVTPDNVKEYYIPKKK
jgi:ABC-type sugar transport system substrate-binding protein